MRGLGLRRALLGTTWIAAVAVLLLAGTARAGEAARTWIVVPAPAFRGAVEPLVRHRRAQGWRVAEVDVEAGAAAKDLADLIHATARTTRADCAVLLVGSVGRDPDAPPSKGDPPAGTVVPAFVGTLGRMRGQPTDNPYGSLDGDRIPEIAVGRLPARSVEEAKAMVAKTLAFEAAPAPRPWRRRLSLLVGNPGGSSLLEKQLASYIVGHEVSSRFATLNPLWHPRAIVNMAASPFFVPAEQLEKESLALVGRGQLLTIYLGHSGASGFFSAGRTFFTRQDWQELAPKAPAGVLLSCGCYACQLRGWGGQGYGLAAIRAARGPVAVVGADASSDGAMGKLAFEGLVPLLASPRPPRHVGAWYLAMKRGIGKGPIAPFVFWLYDHADGSNGKVPLEVLRKEHLEMWMLLGDPALALPVAPAEIDLRADAGASPGHALHVEGTLPQRLANRPVPVEVVVERPFGSVPKGDAALPAGGPERDAAVLRRRRRANERTLLRETTTASGGRFAVDVALPEELPAGGVVVRAAVRGEDADGALRVPLAR